MSKKTPKKKSHAKAKKSTPKPGRKKTVRKVVKKQRQKSVRNPKSNKGKTKIKLATKNKKSIHKKSTGKTNRVPGKSTSGNRTRKPQLVVNKVRGENQVKFSFKGVKAIDKKVALVKGYAGNTLKKQITKHKKPPKAVVIIIKGKGGKQTAKVSPYDFVVNERNVKGFIDGIVEKVKDDYETLRDLMEYDDSGEGGYSDDGSDENFDPDTINEIIVKFIY